MKDYVFRAEGVLCRCALSLYFVEGDMYFVERRYVFLMTEDVSMEDLYFIGERRSLCKIRTLQT